MRRVQLHLDETLDRAAAIEASRRGISKAAFVREAVGRELERVGSSESYSDPWEALIGCLDDDPVDDIDQVIYERPHADHSES
jgi:hypothetical protein